MEKQDQHVICGTERALAQANAIGYAANSVHLVSGMILRPPFYEKPSIDRHAERLKLGLDPNRPTGLVLFGGHGSMHMVSIARRLQEARCGLQLILICGRNERLARELGKIQARVPMHIIGFTQDVPLYMALSDFFIGKPGPGSISEAIEMGLPVIIERNAWTLPQERYNAEWVQEKQVGVVVRNFTEIADAADRLLAEPAFSELRSNAAAIRNRAVFEIADILDRIMDQGG
ncbi:MAG TPA: glycosyltransferase [Bryobacteraceae bacterium]|nr:glycosyltransferase [Bryobacteraceae bacterium]